MNVEKVGKYGSLKAGGWKKQGDEIEMDGWTEG